MPSYFEIQPRRGILGLIGLKEKPRALDPNDQLRKYVTIDSSTYGAETSSTVAQLMPDGSVKLGSSVWDYRYGGLYPGDQEVIPANQVNGHPSLKGKIRVVG